MIVEESMRERERQGDRVGEKEIERQRKRDKEKKRKTKIDKNQVHCLKYFCITINMTRMITSSYVAKEYQTYKQTVKHYTLKKIKLPLLADSSYPDHKKIF